MLSAHLMLDLHRLAVLRKRQSIVLFLLDQQQRHVLLKFSLRLGFCHSNQPPLGAQAVVLVGGVHDPTPDVLNVGWVSFALRKGDWAGRTTRSTPYWVASC